jgi:hypothetical protein
MFGIIFVANVCFVGIFLLFKRLACRVIYIQYMAGTGTLNLQYGTIPTVLRYLITYNIYVIKHRFDHGTKLAKTKLFVVVGIGSIPHPGCLPTP